MSDPEVHIAGWEAAGVIDAPTAARLRAASTGPGAAASVAMTSERSNGPGGAQGKPTSAGSFFGPSLVIGELFAYLGVAFLLGAWLVFLSTFGESQYREAVIAGGQALAAIGLIAIGWFLRAGRRRAAGIAFAAATILAAGCAAYVVQMDFLRNTLQGQAPAVLIAAVALVAAVVLRLVLPAVATQFSMVLSIAALAGASLSWLMQFAYPSDQFGHGGVTLNPVPIPPEPIWLVFAGAAFWLIVALGLGVLGALEARNAERDSGAARRAAITRFLAGVLAVVGTASALSQTGAISGDAYGRLIEGRRPGRPGHRFWPAGTCRDA